MAWTPQKIGSILVKTLFRIMGLKGTTSLPFRKSGNRTNSPETIKKPYVLLVSLDGYRHDYTDRYAPPTLTRLRDEGTSAKSLFPVYPSKTFTNHYSIITGLYAENHGIVANTFFDPDRGELFQYNNDKNNTDGTWYNGMPLWCSAEKQGMLSASYFWPGSMAEIAGIRPTYYCYPYNANVPLEKKLKQIREWLHLPEEKRPHFMTLYIEDVDTAGHYFGPESNEVKEAVFKVDQAIDSLMKEIDSSSLPINFIVVSDHGMQATDPKKVVYLDDYTSFNDVRAIADGAQILIYVPDQKEKQRVYDALHSNAKHYTVYLREDLPLKYHYRNSPRAGDIIVISTAPYSVGLRSPLTKIRAGSHGYDPETTPTMRGIFYAKGPQIKEKMVIEPFQNIHIYPFVNRILGLNQLSPIDGDPHVLDGVYRSGTN